MESPDENPPKRAKLSEPPKHGQRLFFSAMLYWFDSQNQRVGNEVMLVTGASHGLAQFSSAPERLPCSETHSLVLLESRSLVRSGFAFTVENTGARN